jgi:hypothetical protein
MGALKLNKKDICSKSARLHHSFHAKEVSQSCRHACMTHDLLVKEAVLGSKAKLLTWREPLSHFATRVPTHNEYHILWIAAKISVKSILRQKKNYGNSNISPCKYIIFKKSSKRNQKSFKIL